MGRGSDGADNGTKRNVCLMDFLLDINSWRLGIAGKNVLFYYGVEGKGINSFGYWVSNLSNMIGRERFIRRRR